MANSKLSRTSGTPTSTKKFTISFWVKRSNLGSSGNGHIFDTYVDGTNRSQIHFTDESVIDFRLQVSGSNTGRLLTNRKFRDPSSFYHIVASVDTTLSTADDRVKLYINGVQETSFSDRINPSVNADFPMSGTHTLGAYGGGTNYFDGKLTHFHFIDGIGYPASTFGETDVSGIWKPKTAPSVTYGTNGFFLKFENSGAMGTDSSGNTNTFTVAGNLTQNIDSPSNNFCTWNSINPFGGTLTNGNLTVGNNSSYDHNVQGSLGMEKGKFYWEYKMTNTHGQFGVCENPKSPQTDPQSGVGNYFLYNNGNTTGTIFNNVSGSSSSTITVSAFTNGQILGCAYDADNEALYIHQNGVYVTSGDPTSGASKTGAIITNLRARYGGIIVPLLAFGTSGARTNFDVNFGQGFFGTTTVASAGNSPSGGGIFEYDCPTGFQALCTKGINSF